MIRLHEATVQWATERMIIQNGLVTTQMLKLGSEFGELCDHLANNQPIKDDIGDCLVVCTILEEMSGRSLLRTMTTPVKLHTTPMVPQAMAYLGEMMDKSIKGQDFTEEMANFIHQVEGIAKTRHTSLTESWAVAYDDIKDRKGILNKAGNFIKDTDPAYEQAVKEMS